MTKRLLIIQIPIVESTAIDLSRNRLLKIPLGGRDYHDGLRGFLESAFTDNEHGEVERFDYGNGKHNIYIRVKQEWQPVIDRAKAYLGRYGELSDAVIAMQLPDSAGHEVVWPENYSGKFAL